MRLIASFMADTILIVLRLLIILGSVFGAGAPELEALTLILLGALALVVALNIWDAYRLTASHDWDSRTQMKHSSMLISATAEARFSFDAVADQALFGGSASATDVLAAFELPPLTLGAGAGAFAANAFLRLV